MLNQEKGDFHGPSNVRDAIVHRKKQSYARKGRKVRHFNGGLFERATALTLTDDQFELLIEVSRADWRDVEPTASPTSSKPSSPSAKPARQEAMSRL
jgi:hypothetical protein